ncbi:hypothetical protein [Microbacterium sp. USHLN272]|uniref:hypothetical protein n=1 Tax=Microbacterium sp. USHLN272 TaxID=3081287 RepID=UPI0030173439
MLRNLTLDIDDLIDAAQEIPQIVQDSGVLTQMIYAHGTEVPIPLDIETITTYELRGRQLNEDQVRALGVPDRNQLTLQVQMRRWGEDLPEMGKSVVNDISVGIQCSSATISAVGAVSGSTMPIMTSLADFLYKHGKQRPDWPSVKWLRRLIPIPLAIAAWIWLSTAVPLPLPAHALILVLLVAATWGAIVAAWDGIKEAPQRVTGRSFMFRGESRKETYQRRADARKDVKVFLWTAPISVAVGIVGTVVTIWANSQ